MKVISINSTNLILIYFLFLITFSSAIKQLDFKFNLTTIFNVYCKGLQLENFGNQTVYDFCIDFCKDLDIESKSASIFDQYTQVNLNHSKLVDLISKLNSRVRKSQPTTFNIHSNQSFDYLEITGHSGYLFLTNQDNGNFSIDDTINLDPSILTAATAAAESAAETTTTTTTTTTWTNYKILDNVINKTKTLIEQCKSTETIVNSQIVWVNQSVSINGSCCMIANVTLAPGQQIITNNLWVNTTDGGDFLDGEFTWGFILANQAEGNVTGQLTFNETLKATCLESPSINLNDSFRVDYSNLIVGSVSFKHLESESVKISEADENPYSLQLTIPLNGREMIDLCFLTFSQIDLTGLTQSNISSVDLLHLFTLDSDQSFNGTIKMNQVQLDGSQLSDEHQFANKMVDKFSRIVESATFIHCNNLTLDKLNLTNLTTNDLDYLIFNNLKGTFQFNKVIVKGSTDFFGHVNDLNWDKDLVRVDGEEQIDSKLIFNDELIISDHLARQTIGNIPLDNWLVDGDLDINGHINDRYWDTMIGDLVRYNNQTALLYFTESVRVSDCYFEMVNHLDTSNLMRIQNITRQLTFNNLKVEKLILDQVNVKSCLLNDQIVSDSTINPIEQLNIIDLQTDGTINEIEPAQLLINCSDQDFTSFSGSLISSNVSFNNLIVLNESANCDTPELNKITLNRLLRSDPDLKWPETLILRSSNITNFTNPRLVKSLSNLLFNHSEQNIDVDFSFIGLVNFTNIITILDNESSINFEVNFGHQGDIYWDKLNIHGDLTVNNFYNLNEMTNITIENGVTMNESLLVNGTISSPNGDIYADSVWKVHRPSTITSTPNLIVNNLTIEKNFAITNDDILPWLIVINGSLDGMDHYHTVNLTALTHGISFTGNLSYNQLESERQKIELGEITSSTSGDNYLFGQQFTGGVTIKENFTSNSNVDMNLIKINV